MPIGASARPMAALIGFYESHEPPPSGDARGLVPPHATAIEMASTSKMGTFCIFFLFAVALAAAGAIRSE